MDPHEALHLSPRMSATDAGVGEIAPRASLLPTGSATDPGSGAGLGLCVETAGGVKPVARLAGSWWQQAPPQGFTALAVTHLIRMQTSNFSVGGDHKLDGPALYVPSKKQPARLRRQYPGEAA